MGRDIRAIAPGALNQLQAHAWPGNVRELDHVLQRAVALANGETINSFTFAPTAASAANSGAESPDESSLSIPIGTTVHEATKRLVQATVERCEGNKLKAARMLGIPPRTMYRHF